MQNTLSEMWKKHDLLIDFKILMNKRGYAKKDLYCIYSQIKVLNELIEFESNLMLSDLLKKTYFRLLKRINKGIEYLPSIIDSPEEWILNKIENDPSAWVDANTLIFSTKSNVLVFSNISRNTLGYQKYIDNKWQ